MKDNTPLIAVACAVIVLALAFAISSMSVRPPKAHEIGEVTYKGHVYLMMKTTHGYSVLSHAGHCPETHN